ncbi:MAG: PilZ domain-containing protein [Pseudomonadota bacterium]
MAERRRAERRDVYADAVALSNNGRVLKKGIALDLSSNGTRLRFENGDSLIDGMVVNIARYGIKRRARMRWRTRTDIGLEFLDEVE